MESSKPTTQAELEALMYAGGVDRFRRLTAAAEQHGRAHNTPYARQILDDYVLPMAAVIKSECESNTPGIEMAHITLLRPLDPEIVAYLAVRTVLSTLMDTSQDKHSDERYLVHGIGGAIYNELVLGHLADAAPELYQTLVRDLGRRRSRNERHRMTVMKMQAKRNGLTWDEWGIGAKHQVGMRLLHLLKLAGMIEEYESEARYVRKGIKQKAKKFMLSMDLLRHIELVKENIEGLNPLYGPCIEPPIDRSKDVAGGFHSHRMNANWFVATTPSTYEVYKGVDMPRVYAAANALQRTAWRINTKVLDAVMAIGSVTNDGEIVTVAEAGDRPARPQWLDSVTDESQQTEFQKTEFFQWKKHMAEWYTSRKTLASRFSRFWSATRTAEFYRDYPAIYFVYFADRRGRLYPMTYGVNPQGSDLQRSLLHFAEGLPLHTPEARAWFHIQGANKWGFDKAPLAERATWHLERRDLILSFAADPVNNREWMKADKPLQFLAWCFEYADFQRFGSAFESRLPISMDGSCNGLQNLSAMMRDEIGGKATNLTDNTVMEDIYRRVGEAAHRRLGMASELSDVQRKWYQFGVPRGAVKRAVMTTPYGVTKGSATKYVVHDFLAKGGTPFEKAEYTAAAQALMEHAWPAIGDVVVKGRQVMDWLRKASNRIVKTLDPDCGYITWDTPSGFPACQAYFVENVHRIRCRLEGETEVRIRVASESAVPDKAKHANGMAPNFVHSMDAAHLHLTTAALAEAGVPAMAMIHDDYGVHAAHAATLYRVLREQFVAMYEEHDPIAAFAAKYEGADLPKPPAKGKLDIREVLRSQYFFS